VRGLLKPERVYGVTLRSGINRSEAARFHDSGTDNNLVLSKSDRNGLPNVWDGNFPRQR